MKITVIGGGNIGTLMAAEMADRGNEVTVYTPKVKNWSKSIDVLDAEENYILTGELSCVTDDICQAVSGAELIWITVPAQTFGNTAKKLLPYVKKGQLIGIVPGSGGAEFAFYPLIEKGCVLFGLQRVHSIARLKHYGKAVYMLGRKSELQLGAIPQKASDDLAVMVEALLGIPCVPLQNYLCVTLTPSNPILHTTRLWSMFRDYKPGVYYPQNILFYEQWSDDASKMLFACDGELQRLCEAIPLELGEVKSLKLHYESSTPEALTDKIRSIKAFKGLTSPMRAEEEGLWVPDFESRYFTADFDFGLKIILDLCEHFSVDAPNIRQLWQWYESASTLTDRSFFSLNLTQDDLIRLYK